MFVIPLAFGFTISALVGQAIGAGQIAKARKIMWVTIFTCLLTMTVVIVLIHVFGRCYIQQFVDNTVIIEKAYSNLKTYSLFYILDGFQQCMLSTIKALGLQEKVQMFSAFNIFFIGLPMAYVMAIELQFGINGLWYG